VLVGRVCVLVSVSVVHRASRSCLRAGECLSSSPC